MDSGWTKAFDFCAGLEGTKPKRRLRGFLRFHIFHIMAEFRTNLCTNKRLEPIGTIHGANSESKHSGPLHRRSLMIVSVTEAWNDSVFWVDGKQCGVNQEGLWAAALSDLIVPVTGYRASCPGERCIIRSVSQRGSLRSYETTDDV